MQWTERLQLIEYPYSDQVQLHHLLWTLPNKLAINSKLPRKGNRNTETRLTCKNKAKENCISLIKWADEFVESREREYFYWKFVNRNGTVNMDASDSITLDATHQIFTENFILLNWLILTYFPDRITSRHTHTHTPERKRDFTGSFCCVQKKKAKEKSALLWYFMENCSQCQKHVNETFQETTTEPIKFCLLHKQPLGNQCKIRIWFMRITSFPTCTAQYIVRRLNWEESAHFMCVLPYKKEKSTEAPTKCMEIEKYHTHTCTMKLFPFCQFHHDGL